MADAITAEMSLEVRRTFAAPRDRVYAAFTTPEITAQWFCPVGRTAEVHEMDVRVGGRYRITMAGAEGDGHTAAGEYCEVMPGERLAFTWQWQDGDSPMTLVTVSFADVAGGTEVVLLHERFQTEAARDQHRGGWESCLAHFQEYLESL